MKKFLLCLLALIILVFAFFIGNKWTVVKGFFNPEQPKQDEVLDDNKTPEDEPSEDVNNSNKDFGFFVSVKNITTKDTIQIRLDNNAMNIINQNFGTEFNLNILILDTTSFDVVENFTHEHRSSNRCLFGFTVKNFIDEKVYTVQISIMNPNDQTVTLLLPTVNFTYQSQFGTEVTVEGLGL